MGKDKRDCTVVDLLKTCAKNKDLYKGTELHDDTLKKGLLETNPYVASALISMYGKCGALAEAHHVLETLPVQDVVSWNALIAGYAQQGYGLEALACFEKMLNESCSPTWVTLTSILKACGITRDIVKGKQIHHEIVHRGLLERNMTLGNALVDMYAKCGALKKAQEALEELKNRDVVSWSTLIAGYAANNQGHEALKLFACMQREGISPNDVTFTSVLKACGSIGAVDKGTQIHVHIMCMLMLMESIVLGTALVDMYAKCGVLAKAQKAFEEIPHRNLVSWNALISGYTQMGQGCEALNCMEKMKIEGLSPNESTFICLLKACGSIGAIHKGKQIHEEIAKMGLLSKNIVLGTALVDMYVKCGVLGKARQVLEELYIRDVISWNVLIAGYVSQLGQGLEALNCYSQMQREGLFPNEVTFNCILKACGNSRAIGKGKQIHSEIVSRGLLEKNIVLGTAMVDMYTKCSMLAKAHKVLRSLHFRDIVSWNALIAGYAQEGKGCEALDSYTIMQREGLSSDEITFTCILKACGSIGAVEKGKQIHDEIANSGLLVNNVVLGGALVDMYAKFGMLAKAQEVLKELSSRDVVSWSALIAGYAEKGHYEEAHDCFQEMQREGHSPNEITFLCMLNACSHSGKMDEAQIYYENMSKLYGVTPQLEHHTCMVAILGCAGHLGKAMAVLKTILPSTDPSVWLTLLYYCKKWGSVNLGKLIFDQIIQVEDSCTAAYTIMYDIYAAVGLQQDAKKVEAMRVDFCLGRKATMNEHISSSSWNTLGLDELRIKELWYSAWNSLRWKAMRRTECYKKDFTFADLLKSCGHKQNLSGVFTLHAHFLELGFLDTKPGTSTTLIQTYAKCGALREARKVLENLHVRNVVSWNALIAGYAWEGQGHEALDSFDRMRLDGLSPDDFTFTCILKACSITRALDKGKLIHEEIVHRGLLETNIVLGNALVDMYAKCGMLAKAQQVLKELPSRNVVTWSILIAAYAQKGQGHEALRCFEEMQREGLYPDEVTFTGILKSCGSIKSLNKGKQIHEEIIKRGLLKENVVLGNALVDMYVKCGAITMAWHLLEELPVRNAVSWNSMIAGYAQEGNRGHEAFSCFAQMQREGLTPSEITFTCILNACGNIGSLSKGEEIHSEIIRRGLLKKNIVLGNALIDMYAKCGGLEKAHEILEDHPGRNIISWNTLIAGYVEESRGYDALKCLEWMQRDGISPDEVTYIAILKACGTSIAIDKGKQFHYEIVNKDLLGKNILLETSLVDMYAKCGMLVNAQKILEELHVRDTISWNALIAGYAEEGQGHEALNCFTQMQREGLSPDGVTFTLIVKACGRIGAICKGKQIHEEIVSRRFLEKNITLGNALVDMYVKCGMLGEAQQVLEELPVRDTVSWSALIAGYAEKGYRHEALNCFEQMQREGISPNDVTFLCILNACSHSGRLDDAETYYANMSRKYGIAPQIEHHTCMVISFGQAGCFDKATAVIKSVSYLDDPSLWLALLGACGKWGYVKLGRLSFDHVIQVGNDFASAYVIMANIYAAAGMQEDAEKIENMRVKNGL